MDEDDWSYEMRLIESRGFSLSPGLTDAEIDCVEREQRFRFPPDLRSLLAHVMPISKYGELVFPDWRSTDPMEHIDKLERPFNGIAFDIEHGQFWWEPWGPRPRVLSDAIAIAKAAVDRAPRLIPVLGHRYMPAEPELSGNPVFSVHQADIIYYGIDLRRYIAHEFGAIDHAELTRFAIKLLKRSSS
jgi:hypothetical protein